MAGRAVAVAVGVVEPIAGAVIGLLRVALDRHAEIELRPRALVALEIRARIQAQEARVDGRLAVRIGLPFGVLRVAFAARGRAGDAVAGNPVVLGVVADEMALQHDVEAALSGALLRVGGQLDRADVVALGPGGDGQRAGRLHVGQAERAVGRAGRGVVGQRDAHDRAGHRTVCVRHRARQRHRPVRRGRPHDQQQDDGERNRAPDGTLMTCQPKVGPDEMDHAALPSRICNLQSAIFNLQFVIITSRHMGRPRRAGRRPGS
ncbi:MAG: hypothetical protein BWY52_01566 [Chloroflexi bacterium ADurb.Bin325]|nr:MAG: hypothetical protein BWY52_01566 [Chloroflexi bacterium ADurb.Bin325]